MKKADFDEISPRAWRFASLTWKMASTRPLTAPWASTRKSQLLFVAAEERGWGRRGCFWSCILEIWLGSEAAAVAAAAPGLPGQHLLNCQFHARSTPGSDFSASTGTQRQRMTPPPFCRLHLSPICKFVNAYITLFSIHRSLSNTFLRRGVGWVERPVEIPLLLSTMKIFHLLCVFWDVRSSSLLGRG